jgi:DNA-binding transcriptional LysR family regulator
MALGSLFRRLAIRYANSAIPPSSRAVSRPIIGSSSPRPTTLLDAGGRPHLTILRHACLVVGTLDLWTFLAPGGETIVRKVAPTLRINDGEAVREAACAGLGIAWMATWCAADELRNGALVPALPAFPLVSTQTLWALYPKSRELAPEVRVFVDWMVTRIGSEPYWDRGLQAILEGTGTAGGA